MWYQENLAPKARHPCQQSEEDWLYLDEITGDISPRNVQPSCEMGKSKALVYRTYMGHAITSINDHTS